MQLGFRLFDRWLFNQTCYFFSYKFLYTGSAPSFIETLVTLFDLVHFKNWIEGDLVLGFLIDGFLTRLAIFSVVNFFVLGSAPSFIETSVALIGLVNFEDRIEGNLVLGFLANGFLTRLAIFLAINFFALGSAPSFTETLVTLFGLVCFENGLKVTWF